MKEIKSQKMRLHFPIPPFSPFLPNLGGLEKVGPEGYEILCLLFSPVNQTVEIPSLPSISFPFPPLPAIPSIACERERELREEKALGIRQSNQVQRQYFFCILYFLKKFYTIIILVKQIFTMPRNYLEHALII